MAIHLVPVVEATTAPPGQGPHWPLYTLGSPTLWVVPRQGIMMDMFANNRVGLAV